VRVHLAYSHAIMAATMLCAAGAYVRQADMRGYRTTNLREP